MTPTLALLISCLGVQNGGTPQPQSSSPPAGDLLAGPSAIENASVTPTIVQRSFDGLLEDIGPEPDVAAIEQLQLSEQQKAKLEQLRTERYAEFDKLVGKNYGLITEFAAALGAQNRAQSIELGQRIRDAFEPYFKRGSTLDEFAAHLTEAQVGHAYRMVGEYMQARAAEFRDTMGENARPAQVATRARLEMFGQLVRQSIERQVSLGREAFEELAEQLELTSQQKSRIESIYGPIAVQKLQGNKVDGKVQVKALAELNKVLTPAQRAKLLKLLIARWVPPAEVDANASQE